MDGVACSQSIMPAALPLHYGDTIPTHRPARIYHMYCHTDREVESADLRLAPVPANSDHAVAMLAAVNLFGSG